MTTLYKKHASGNIGTWTIVAHYNEIQMTTQLAPGGAQTTRTEVVHSGLAGRCLEAQVESRIQSRIKTKLDRGYKRTEQEAKAGSNPTNTLDMPMPMLAARKIDKLGDEVYIQPKLDGMRLIITRQAGEVFAYSRGGKLIETIPHIIQDASDFLNEGEFIDGELYAHDTPLQTIMSWAKRSQRDTRKLRFHMFDMIADIPFRQRYESIYNRHCATLQIDTNLVLVPTARMVDMNDVANAMRDARNTGYEGLILRDGTAPYRIGKRSPHVVKVKQFIDEEYPVIGTERSVRAGVPMLVCRMPDGQEFKAVAPGTYNQKERAISHPEEYVGHQATIAHVGLTPYGLPFQPVCKGIRDEE